MLEIYKLLKDHPDACNFVSDYRNYIHGIDDIIDGDLLGSEGILHIFHLASKIFSSDFYHQYRQYLFPIEILINNTYADSCLWEKSGVNWKHRDSGVLRHTGIDMFLFVVYIVAGRQKMREISEKFRSQCHEFHMTKEEKPI